MRIGLFTDTYTPEVNGVVNSVLMLNEGLSDLGHEVFVFAPGNPEALPDANVYRSHAMALPVLKERRLALPWSASLWSAVRNLDLNIIHTHTEFGVGSFGFRARRQLNIPQVHTYHTVWEDYTHYVTKGKVLDKQARGVVRNQTRRALKHVNHIIVPTVKTLDLLTSYETTAPITVIPTGVDLIRFAPSTKDDHERLALLRDQYKTSDFAHTLLMLGRIAPEKSVRQLLEMTIPYLHEHPETCLLVVGDGPSLGELIARSSSSGVGSQVFFTGEVSWETVPDFYRISDVLIGNSDTETQGLTNIEAIASGVPVIARYNSCFDGILEDKVNASLFTESEQYIPMLEEMFDPHIQSARIEAGLKAASALSKPAFVSQVENVYKQLIDSG
jgi:1,2-diacylglycerol 3-alpha-glucosyltransferase